MESVRRYLMEGEGEVEGGSVSRGSGGTPVEEKEKELKLDDEETRSFLSSGRIEGRSSDAKSIGSLSQHFFESDDNEDDKYIGTCNGYDSHPGSKSNLLLCTECDLRSKTCTYRPQTPSQIGRFVEERIDRQTETKSSGGGTRNQQERRGASTAKSPVKFEGSPRYWRDEHSTEQRSERKTKNVSLSPSNLAAAAATSSRTHDQEQTRIVERQRDPDPKHYDNKYSNATSFKNSLSANSPRFHPDIDQRTANRHQDTECDERTSKNSRERYRHSRSPVQICDRSPRRKKEMEEREWSRGEDLEEENGSEDQDYLEESEESPPCPLCNGSNGNSDVSRCAHCHFSSDQDDPDLICFQCQMSAEEETTSVEGSICQKCENMCNSRSGTNGSSCQTTSSSSEGAKYPVDAVVKIHVNNRSIDVDSDDTIDGDPPSNNHDNNGAEVATGAAAASIDRLETILEVKNDTASENGEDNSSKINGQPRTKYLNYMIVLLL